MGGIFMVAMVGVSVFALVVAYRRVTKARTETSNWKKRCAVQEANHLKFYAAMEKTQHESSARQEALSHFMCLVGINPKAVLEAFHGSPSDRMEDTMYLNYAIRQMKVTHDLSTLSLSDHARDGYERWLSGLYLKQPQNSAAAPAALGS
jgi:hypothetical protein